MSESIAVRTSKLPDLLTSRELTALLNSVLTDLTTVKAQFNQLRTDFNAHVHGGITAGAANSSAPTATTATAVALNTVS